MKTLIVYATKYGATRLCAERIAAKLPGQTDLFDLATGGEPNLDAYDGALVGTSVYVGRPRKEAARFLKRYGARLLEKPLGLFLCCMQDVSQSVSEQVKIAFPREVRDHAGAIGALGGRVDFEKLKGLDRPLMNLISGDLRKKSGANVVDTLSDARIAQFVATYLAAWEENARSAAK